MKRTPLRPGTKGLARSPLRRGTNSLRRKTRLNPVNEERAARLRRVQFGAKAEWIRSLPCATCQQTPPSDPSHVKSRGAGGKTGALIPQCRTCHQEFHAKGVATFEAQRGMADGALNVVAVYCSARWEALPAEEREHWERVYARRHLSGIYKTAEDAFAAALRVWPGHLREGSAGSWTLYDPAVGLEFPLARLTLTREKKWRMEVLALAGIAEHQSQ